MKNSTFTDSAILIAATTASFFIIGYLHEVPFLEKFGLNNEEFIPNSTSLIACGFKYLFIKLAAPMVFISFIFIIYTVISLTFKEKVLEWISKKLKIEELINFKTFMIYSIISAIPFFTIIVSSKVIKDGIKSYEEYLNLSNQSNLDVLYTEKYSEGMKGKVIRHYENKIAFFDVDEKIAKVFPDSQIVELKYSVAQQK